MAWRREKGGLRAAKNKVDSNLAQAKQALAEEKEREMAAAAAKVEAKDGRPREASPPLEEAPNMQTDSIQRKLRDL